MSAVDRALRYEASPKHCEPITAQKPGTKCPAWSVALADDLLSVSKMIGGKRFATNGGVAFVGQLTRCTDDTEIWHSYPEAWDRIPTHLKSEWREAGVITRRDLKQFRTQTALVQRFGGRL